MHSLLFYTFVPIHQSFSNTPKLQTFFFLLILEAAISITHAERVSVGNNPIMVVFFAAFFAIFCLQKPPLLLFSFWDAARLH